MDAITHTEGQHSMSAGSDITTILDTFRREAPHCIWSARFVRHDDNGFPVDAEDDDATFAMLFDRGVYVADVHRLETEATDAELLARVRTMLSALNAKAWSNGSAIALTQPPAKAGEAKQ